MKTILLLFFSFSLITLQGYGQDYDKEDWALDPKTSTLVPKFVAKIKILKGNVLRNNGKLSRGDKINTSDLIRTEERSSAVLDFADRSVVTIGPNSEFQVAEWVYRTKNDRDMTLTLLRGQMRALIQEKSQKDDQIKIKTKVAALGVRGTELLVNSINNQSQEITQIALLEGLIHLTGEGLPKEVDLLPGDYLEILKIGNEVKEEKRKLSKEELKDLEGTLIPGFPNLLNISKNSNNLLNSKLQVDKSGLPPSTYHVDKKSSQEILDELNKHWKEQLESEQK